MDRKKVLSNLKISGHHFFNLGPSLEMGYDLIRNHLLIKLKGLVSVYSSSYYIIIKDDEKTNLKFGRIDKSSWYKHWDRRESNISKNQTEKNWEIV